MSIDQKLAVETTAIPTAQSEQHHEARHFHTAVGTTDRAGEVAERLVSDYGGDALNGPPPALAALSSSPLAAAHADSSNDNLSDDLNTNAQQSQARARSRSQPLRQSSIGHGHRLMKVRTDGAPSTAFPPLTLVDSAFEDAHRVLSRESYRDARNQPDPHASSEGTTVEGSDDGGSEPKVDATKVQWYEADPDNPQNWSYRYKWIVTAIVSLLTINVTFASTAPSPATVAFAVAFDSSIEVSVLATSLFLFGYCTGPLLWAPLSEIYGRRPIFLITMAVYTIFQIGDALAQNMATLLVVRFISGTFAAAPLSNAGGVVADIWDPVGRGPAMSAFSASVFLGPVIGPIVGGYLTESYLGFRWIFWIQMIFAALCLAIVAAYLPETYAPVLLAQRARRLRQEDPVANKELWADLERADFSFSGIVTRTLARPFIMIYKEPILLFVTIYMSIVYGLLYALFSIAPLVWTVGYGFNLGETGLIFIFVGIGTTLGAGINIWLVRDYKNLVPKWHGHPPPERRLVAAMLAGPFLIVGIFWLGWTADNPTVIPWYVPGLSFVLIGMSFTLVFISFLTYLIEVYLMYAASALAISTVVRSAVGGIFPLFTDQFFKSAIGIGGACSVIGAIGIIIAPIPIIFYYYGARIRGTSTFAPCLDLKMIEIVEREEREEREKNGEVDEKKVEKIV